ncbi:MAG: hypothetical protein K2J67_09790 [Lachnospiraceae bacterium]|nr:hypothetical protein [Lachnospiraceae bacterium]
MMALTDYLSEQVLEVVAKSIKNKFQYHHLIDAVQEIEREYKQAEFEYLSQQEEFDWDGLKQYIEDHLLTNISSVFLSPNQDIRKALRKRVYICAYSSAQANTVAKQRQVDRLMDKVLIQVRSFLCEQQEPMDLMPFNEVTDQICVSLDTWGEEIKTTIQQQTQQIEKQIEHLQESLQYQHSFAKSVDHLKLPQPIHSLFHYRDPHVGFYGREKEITYLDRFLDCEDPILFTAVNGPAGAGKSKFLYEYMKGLASNPKWKCLFLQSKKIIEKFLALD